MWFAINFDSFIRTHKELYSKYQLLQTYTCTLIHLHGTYHFKFSPSSSDFQPCYMHAVKLLSSLSGFQVTRKAWRKEAFDLFLDPSFFAVELEALREWKVVIDNLMTQDQVTFRDLLTRLNTSAATNVVNIFSSLEQVHMYVYNYVCFYRDIHFV